MEVSVTEFLKRIGLHETYEDSQESESQYLRFKPHDFQRIDVESTASNLIEALTKMPLDAQSKLFVELAKLVPEVGDQLILNRPEGDKKLRGARVVRLKADTSSCISLLITR